LGQNIVTNVDEYDIMMRLYQGLSHANTHDTRANDADPFKYQINLLLTRLICSG
jgi:hypothetical protein